MSATEEKSVPQRPLPDLDDPISAPFYRAARDGIVQFQKCANCGYLRWPSAPICPECWSDQFAWSEVAPTGTIWSFVGYHRAFNPAFTDMLPYVVALVELDAGPQMISNIVGVPEEELAVGMRVTAVFEPFGEEALVNFVPERPEGGAR